MTAVVDPTKSLTPRQLELIALYASGCGLREIAARKFLSYKWVQEMLTDARERVGASTLPQLCAITAEAGLIVRNGNGFKPVQRDGIVSE